MPKQIAAVISRQFLVSAEVFLNLGGTADMLVRPKRLLGAIFLSVL